MRRSQWWVLGIGLVLMSFFFGFISGMNDCLAMQSKYMDIAYEAMDSNLSMEYIQGVIASSDSWGISCSDTNIYVSLMSTISFTLGIIFIILGFLEPKKK